jgi:hypothetical protein
VIRRIGTGEDPVRGVAAVALVPFPHPVTLSTVANVSHGGRVVASEAGGSLVVDRQGHNRTAIRLHLRRHLHVLQEGMADTGVQTHD